MSCHPRQPIIDCEIEFEGAGEGAEPETEVSLVLNFEVTMPMSKGDFIEFALPGFTTDTSEVTSTTSIEFEKEMMPPLSDGSGAPMIIPKFMPLTETTSTPANLGCYKAFTSEGLL
jgi:hypothetical protein